MNTETIFWDRKINGYILKHQKNSANEKLDWVSYCDYIKKSMQKKHGTHAVIFSERHGGRYTSDPYNNIFFEWYSESRRKSFLRIELFEDRISINGPLRLYERKNYEEFSVSFQRLSDNYNVLLNVIDDLFQDYDTNITELKQVLANNDRKKSILLKKITPLVDVLAKKHSFQYYLEIENRTVLLKIKTIRNKMIIVGFKHDDDISKLDALPDLLAKTETYLKSLPYIFDITYEV